MKLLKKHIFFKKNENLTLCDPVLTQPFSVVDLHWVRLQNGLDFRILRAKLTISHVSHVQKVFLILVTFLDLCWPDLDHDPCLVWHLCSQSIFTRPLILLWLSVDQKLSILPALGFVIQKRKNMTFDLTLTTDVRSILNS